MLELFNTAQIITWIGTAGVIFGSGKVLMNGMKHAINETRRDVREIKANQTATDVKVGVLNERTLNIAETVSRLEARIE